MDNPHLLGVGCPAHILHNTLNYAVNLLPIDIESAIIKIYNHFSVYTVRTEKLKDFSVFVEVDYHKILKHTKTRWLSLFLVIVRVMKMFKPLKSYFLSESSVPLSLKFFFENPLNEAYLFFVHSLSSVFHINFQKIENGKNSVIEVLEILISTEESIQNRVSNNFMPLAVKEILKNNSDLTTECLIFEKHAIQLYHNCLKYLTKWTSALKEFHIFNWMGLNKISDWTEVQTTVEFVLKRKVVIDDIKLCDQYLNLKTFIQKVQNDEFKNNISSKKWVYFFKHFPHKEQHSEFLVLCQFFYTVFGHNANIERVFSLITAQWTEERNRLDTDTVKSIILCKFNLKHLTCGQFYEAVLQDKTVLKEIGTSEKYENEKKKDL